MKDNVTIQVGEKNLAIKPSHLPPVGTRIVTHKHLTSDGTSTTLEVVDHDWRLEEPTDIDGLPVFSITIKTRTVD